MKKENKAYKTSEYSKTIGKPVKIILNNIQILKKSEGVK